MRAACLPSIRSRFRDPRNSENGRPQIGLGEGEEKDREGFHVRVFQQEFDHLDGEPYPRRIRDMTQFGFVEALFSDNLSAGPE